MIVDRGLRRTKSPVGHRRRKPKSPAPEPFDDAPAARPASPKVRVPGALDGDFHFTTALAFRMSPPAGRYRPRTTPAAALGQSRARRANVPRLVLERQARRNSPAPSINPPARPVRSTGARATFFSLSLSLFTAQVPYISARTNAVTPCQPADACTARRRERTATAGSSSPWRYWYSNSIAAAGGAFSSRLPSCRAPP